MINGLFTSAVKAEIEEEGQYVGPLLSEEELDFLLDYHEETNPSFHTQLAEAMIERSTGLRVDLATQGPAVFNLSRASDSPEVENMHNTYTVTQSEYRKRIFDPSHPDTRFRPKITPLDANIASTSIDFALSRPRGTLIDGMRLDGKENPVETCFLNQVTVMQILEQWGANVDSLITFCEDEWGIDYVRQLLDDIALAPIKDMPMFLASGGRPPPNIYISANFMSMVSVISKPTVSAESIGVSSIFTGRCVAMAKFILATCNLVRGTGAVRTLSFNMNAGQFGLFDPSVFNGVVLEHGFRASACKLANTIVGITSYAKFVKARQSLKHAIKCERTGVLGDVEKVSMMLKPSSSYGFKSSAGEIMTGSGGRKPTSSDFVEEAAPSKVTTMLFSFFHQEDKTNCIDALISSQNTLMVLSASGASRVSLASCWPIISRMKGMCDLLGAVPVSRVVRIEEVREAMIGSSNERRLASVYLVARTLSLAQVTLSSVHATCVVIASTGKVPRKLSQTQDLYVGKYPRTLRLFEKVAAVITKLRPFIYGQSVRQSFANGVANVSVLGIQISRMVSSASDLDGWERSTKNRKVDVTTQNAARVRHMFAHARREWTAHYDGRLHAYRESITLLMAAVPTTAWPGLEIRGDCPRSGYAIHALAIEYVVMMARSLAYKYSKVTVNLDLGESKGNEAIAKSVDAYVDILKNCSIDDTGGMVQVDMKEGQFDSNSYLVKHMTVKLKSLGDRSNVLSGAMADLKKIAKLEYINCKWRVWNSFVTAMKRDWRHIHANDVAVEMETMAEHVHELADDVENVDLSAMIGRAVGEDDMSPNEKTWNYFLSTLSGIADELCDVNIALAKRIKEMSAQNDVCNALISSTLFSRLRNLLGKIAGVEGPELVHWLKGENLMMFEEAARIMGLDEKAGVSIMT